MRPWSRWKPAGSPRLVERDDLAVEDDARLDAPAELPQAPGRSRGTGDVLSLPSRETDADRAVAAGRAPARRGCGCRRTSARRRTARLWSGASSSEASIGRHPLGAYAATRRGTATSAQLEPPAGLHVSACGCRELALGLEPVVQATRRCSRVRSRSRRPGDGPLRGPGRRTDRVRRSRAMMAVGDRRLIGVASSDATAMGVSAVFLSVRGARERAAPWSLRWSPSSSRRSCSSPS